MIVIDTRIRKVDGKKVFVYRLFDTNTENYLTGEMTDEKQLKDLLLEMEWNEFVCSFNEYFPNRLAYAKRNGTSSLLLAEHWGLNSGWRDETEIKKKPYRRRQRRQTA